MDKDTILCILAANLPNELGVSAEFTANGLAITDPTTGKTFLVSACELLGKEVA